MPSKTVGAELIDTLKAYSVVDASIPGLISYADGEPAPK